MAVRRAFLYPPLTRLLPGLRHGPQHASRGTCCSEFTQKQTNALGGRPYVFSTIAQERFCSTSVRSSCTIREGPDGQEGLANSSSYTSSEIQTDPSPETEISSAGDSDVKASSMGHPTSMNLAVESTFKSSSRHDLAMVFTCTVCNVRSAKTMSRATYDTGVVIVRCPGCQNLHLIADRYGWFGEPGSVEDFLAEKGVDVRKGSDSSYEFSLEDMAGWTPKGTNAGFSSFD